MIRAMFEKVAILGSGGMGTALAILFAGHTGSVALWARDRELAEQIRRLRENPRHLPSLPIPESVQITTSAAEAWRGADLIVAAIPSSFLRSVLEPLAPTAPVRVPVLSVIKGLELDTLRWPSQVLSECIGPRPLAVLSGPSHAEEIARGLPASVVVAGADAELNLRIQTALNHGRFRVYTNPDLPGVEMAGGLKNILGIAAGICEGLGFGDNAKAALLTRGLVEMNRFVVAEGGASATLLGLAGIGDVITTCYSPYGRNRGVGLRIGRGESLVQILASMTEVAEGVNTTQAVHRVAATRGLDLPITTAVHAILFEGKAPLNALSELMLRPPRGE
jgi:glycerol-3-phosphate dehydrogenase (NAD(P)+)